MKTNKLTLSILCTSLLLSSCTKDLAPIPNPSDAMPIPINLNAELQTMDGFGASDGWRCQFVGKNWPLDKRNAIADLLFSQDTTSTGSPKGIALSIWRFNIGAGTAEQGTSSNIATVWTRSECFQNTDGTYDWTKQAGQRWFLQAAKVRGVKHFLGWTNSAPVQMTANGYGFSDPNRTSYNIASGKMADYADFLVTVVDNLQRNEGVNFDYLSPFNEPQWGWTAGSNGIASQEGSPATNEDMSSLTKLLSTKLAAKSLKTQVVLGEAGSIDYLYSNVNKSACGEQIKAFWGDPSATTSLEGLPNVMKAISAHSYFTTWPISTQVDDRETLGSNISQVSGLKYWETEFCILESPGSDVIPGGNGNGRDLGMQTALYVARVIHNDIAVANASSWQWWTALTQADYKDGLVYLDDGASNGGSGNSYCLNDGVYHDSKLLWALGNYSYFIRPGMVHVQITGRNSQTSATGVMISAFKDPTTKRLVLVLVNENTTSKKYSLDLSGATLKGNTLTPYVTSDTENLQKDAAVKADSFVIPAKSIVTYVGEYQ